MLTVTTQVWTHIVESEIGVVTTTVTVFTNIYIYVITMMKVGEDQIFLLAERMNSKNASLISLHSFCDAISLCRCKEKIV